MLEIVVTFLSCLNPSKSPKKNALFLTIGPPSVPPVLMAAQRGLAGRGLEETDRVHAGIAEKLPGVSMKLVAAAAIGDVNRRAGRPAVFRAHVVGDDPELRDGVGSRLHHLVRETLVARTVCIVVDAIDQEVVERAAKAIDVERTFAGRPRLVVVQGRQTDTGREKGERRVLASVQRKRPRLIAGNDLSACARIGFDKGGGARYLYLLAQLTDIHLRIDSQACTDLHADIFDHGHGEAALLHGQQVETGADIEELVIAFRVRVLRHRDACRKIRQRHGRFGYHGVGRIANRTEHRGRFELCMRGCHKEHHDQQGGEPFRSLHLRPPPCQRFVAP